MVRWTAMAGLMMVVAAAVADVNLEWRPEHSIYEVGDTVRIGLYAVSDDPEGETFCAMQVVVLWDADRVLFRGNTDPSPPPGWPWPTCWMSSGFPNDAGLDGLNLTFDDGDAYYHLWCHLPRWAGDRASVGVATPEGLLVTTLEFEATAPGRADLWIEAVYGQYSSTAVLDDAIPGLNVVGDLGATTVQILPFDVSGETHRLLEEWRETTAGQDFPISQWPQRLREIYTGRTYEIHEIVTWGVEG